jgi:hypothetical protein
MTGIKIVLSPPEAVEELRDFLEKFLPSDRHITHVIRLSIDNKAQQLRVHPRDVQKVLAERLGYIEERESPRTLFFSGFEWDVKSSISPAGPGPNYFSISNENVWIDDQNQMHLKIALEYGRWCCSEVICKASLGYGKYIFYIASRVDELDRNAVLGLFLWDSNAPAEQYREIDIEFSKWGKESGNNAHFVVHPSEVVGNMRSFHILLNGDYSTHSIDWRPSHITFESIHGHYVTAPIVPHLIESWTQSGSKIPSSGQATPRMNLWLFGGNPPHKNREVEVIVKRFEFIAM